MTLKAVAQNAGVSMNTVRKVLDDDPTVRSYIKERVLKSVRRLDYQPNLVARALREQALQLVPISVIELENPYFGSLASHLSKCLAAAGLEPALCLDGHHLLRMSRTLKTCGCILCYWPDPAVSRVLAKRQRVVTIDPGGKAFEGQGTVVIDFAEVYRNVAQVLVKRGRRHIAIVSAWAALWSEKVTVGSKFEAMLAGIRLAGGECVGREGKTYFPDARSLAGFVAAGRGPVDAVFCENDLEAAIVHGHLAARGVRMPEDMLLVGCDANHLLPGMWSVKIETRRLAAEAVGMLVQLLAGERVIAPYIYRPALVDETGATLTDAGVVG